MATAWHGTIGVVALCGGLLVGADRTAAQVPPPGTIPSDRVDLLLDSYARRALTFLPGTLPEALRSRFTWPRDIHVIGSLVSQGSTKVVFESPDSATAIAAFYRRMLPERGWRQQPSDRRDKFVVAHREDYCDALGTLAFIKVLEQDTTRLVAFTVLHPTGNGCRAEPVRPPQLHHWVPDLLLPAGATLEDGGMARIDRSPGFDAVETMSAVIGTRQPARVVLAHFGQQLASVDWILQTEWTGARSAGQVWRREFADGLGLTAALTLVELESDLVEASLTVAPTSQVR